MENILLKLIGCCIILIGILFNKLGKEYGTSVIFFGIGWIMGSFVGGV